ncbi:MAG: hypothetical protein LVS60_07465 [Nodosilinea sp. LVE1205-7]|jgi:hypothetical protein
MVLFMHIDYNNSCTRVFRMCLMVIDICIDETLRFLGQIALKTVISEVSGQLSVVSSQKPWPPTPSPLDRLLYPPCVLRPVPVAPSPGLQAERRDEVSGQESVVSNQKGTVRIFV